MVADLAEAWYPPGGIIRTPDQPALSRKASIWIILLVVTLAACGGAGERLGTLRAMPESALAYPGSEEVAAGGSDGGMTIDGPQGAFSWRWLGADASDEEVERFYAEELGSRGWTGGRESIRSTGEFRAREWQKGNVVFRLAFPDPEQRADPAPFSRYQTIYDARLQETRSDD